MLTRQDALATRDPSHLDPREIFGRLPANRCGERDRQYLNEVLDDGFGNKESAGMLERFEGAFAEGFGVGFGPSLRTATRTRSTSTRRVSNVTSPSSSKRSFQWSVYGLAPDFDAILELAKQHDLTVIEDDAECFLGTYKGKLVGTLGNAASFSFQGSKHMTSGGDGGMVITDDEDYARDIRKASSQGYRTLQGKPGSTMIPRDERQDWAFERHDRLGYNFRMSAPQAALGLAQLERLDYLVAAR